MARTLSGISSCMAGSRADSLPFLFLPFESPPPPCDLFRDLLAPAAEERADGNAKSRLVCQPGLKGRSAVAGFIARYLHARRGAEEISKLRLSQVRVAAISAEVVFKRPSVGVCHCSTKNRRLAGSSVESGYVSWKFSGRQTSGRKLGRVLSCLLRTTYGLNQIRIIIMRRTFNHVKLRAGLRRAAWMIQPTCGKVLRIVIVIVWRGTGGLSNSSSGLLSAMFFEGGMETFLPSAS